MAQTDVMTPEARVKQLKAESVQWENRLEYLKNEHGNLSKQKELLQATIDAKTMDYQAYIAGREKSLRDNQEKLAQDQKVLEIQREEFKGILNSHQAEKNLLAKEKDIHDKEKAKFEGAQRSVQDFIQAVRRAYNVLPD